MNNQDCRSKLLATGDIGHVTTCPDCGQVHLVLQYITLRFDTQTFRMLADLINHAQYRMERDAQTNHPANLVAGTPGIH